MFFFTNYGSHYIWRFYCSKYLPDMMLNNLQTFQKEVLLSPLLYSIGELYLRSAAIIVWVIIAPCFLFA